MDEIQRVLIEAGRKDLAQKYYKKVAGKIPGVPDGTGPYGRGLGPGKGKGDGTGLKVKKEIEEKENKEEEKKKEEK